MAGFDIQHPATNVLLALGRRVRLAHAGKFEDEANRLQAIVDELKWAFPEATAELGEIYAELDSIYAEDETKGSAS